MTVVLREEAEEDIREAREWYEAQRPGLGDEFIAELVPGITNPLVSPDQTK